MRYPACFQETAIVHHRRRLFNEKGAASALQRDD